MYNFLIFFLILAVRQQTAESARTTAHVLFQTQTPVSLADSYLTVDIAVPLPKLLNVDLRPIYKLFNTSAIGTENMEELPVLQQPRNKRTITAPL